VVWKLKDVTKQLGKDGFIDPFIINFTEAVCTLVRGKIRKFFFVIDQDTFWMKLLLGL
jgi:hypothetical protein